MLPTCLSSLVLVPIVKLLKPTLSTPSVLGDSGTIPGFPWIDLEALRGQTDADSSDRFAKVIRVAQVAEAKFIHGGRAERFGVAEAKQLRPARIKRIETRNVRSALSDRVGIVLRPVVEKVIGGHQPPARVGIKAVGAFIVARSFVEG